MNGLRERWSQHRITVFEEQRLAPWYGTRRRRRAMVALAGAGLGLLWADAAVSWGLASGGTAAAVNLVLLAAMLLLYLPAVTVLNAATRGGMELAERYLDERQLGERLRAAGAAHRLGNLMLWAVTIVVMIGTWGRDRELLVPAAGVFLLLLAVTLTHFALPLLVAGWRMPDPPAEEDEEPTRYGAA